MKSEEIDKEWAEISSRIKAYPTINTSQMNAFFSRIVPQVMSEDYLLLTADNDFIKTWIERHYVDYMHKALKEMHGVDYVIEIEVDVNQEADGESAAPTPSQQQPIEQTRQDAAEAEYVQQRAAKTVEKVDEQIQKSEPKAVQPFNPTSTLTFENFVIGESNRMAYSMSVAVAEVDRCSTPSSSMENQVWGKPTLCALSKITLTKQGRNFALSMSIRLIS